jgi:hypothetical protein
MFGTSNYLFGVSHIAHAVGCLRNGGECKAQLQVRPDEIKACLFSFVLNPQRFEKKVAHVHILDDQGNQRPGPSVRLLQKHGADIPSAVLPATGRPNFGVLSKPNAVLLTCSVGENGRRHFAFVAALRRKGQTGRGISPSSTRILTGRACARPTAEGIVRARISTAAEDRR